ncbi:hypothetical protein AAVH_40995 [Aphelenchoides avenae]|nr:hypothetical protein AAVH_40995 [Aphelenchus avenae]
MERRSPEGKLLSVSYQKTVYYGDAPDEELHVAGNSQVVYTTPCTEAHGPYHAPSVRRHESDRYSAKTEVVDPRRPHFGDNTLYGDDWSQAETYVKTARLVRSASCQSIGLNLSLILDRINRLRRLYGVTELRRDDRLMREAKELAMQVSLKNNRRTHDSVETNIWVGFDLHESVVDEWNDEMSCWQRNYFRCPRLSRVGIGHAQIPYDSKHVVVVVYE